MIPDTALIISPSKNLEFLQNVAPTEVYQIFNNFDANGELFYDEEEDLRQ
jgi:hypothetical protein